MKSWLEVEGAALRHNLDLFGTFRKAPMMLVVKANAYGHGLTQVLEATRSCPGLEWYGVDSSEEALAVRANVGDRPVLVMGWTEADEALACARAGCHLVAADMDWMQRVSRLAIAQGVSVPVHVKVETGTARLGMNEEDVLRTFRTPFPGIRPVGLYSHYANVEDTTDHRYALMQKSRFDGIWEKMGAPGGVRRHFSCSAASLLFPQTHYDLIRVGISAYGYWPSKSTLIALLSSRGAAPELRPALTWKARIAQVKDLDADAYIGYGLSYQTLQKTRIAVIPVGYQDGYDRALSNVAHVLIKGKRAPVRGRICMNMFMVECGHIPDVRSGDEVVLLGKQGGAVISADTMADWAGTINYEILARIHHGLPRIVV